MTRAPFPIDDQASVILARAQVDRVGDGLDEPLLERARIIVSELATNQLRYGSLGEILLDRIPDGLVVDARDHGQGLAQPWRSIWGVGESGSSGGGLGMGLPGVRRLATAVDVENRAGEGLRIVARVLPDDRSPGPHYALIGRPHPHETVSGDDAAVYPRDGGTKVVVMADGLGHGPAARVASRQALAHVRSHLDEPPDRLLLGADRALRPTRGAAVGIAVVHDDHIDASIAGNVRMVVVGRDGSTHIRSTACVIGDGRGRSMHRRRIAIPPGGALLLAATDGVPERSLVGLRWDGRPLLRTAVELVHTHGRTTDDVTALLLALPS